MTGPHARPRGPRPHHPRPHARVRQAVTGLIGALACTGAMAQAIPPGHPPTGPAAAPAAKAPATPSALDAPLFYQLLIGELELRDGRPGNAYQVILDAARRQSDDDLFQRAADIAVQARAGEQALAAVKAWREARPQSVGALRYQVQILLALNRGAELGELEIAGTIGAVPGGRWQRRPG